MFVWCGDLGDFGDLGDGYSLQFWERQPILCSTPFLACFLEWSRWSIHLLCGQFESRLSFDGHLELSSPNTEVARHLFKKHAHMEEEDSRKYLLLFQEV